MENQDDNQNNHSYSGRWVAKIRGRIIAQGGTPEQALQAAKNTRYKEKPEILFMNPLEEIHFPDLFLQIREIFKDGLEVFLVGGAVRDLFLHRPIHDLDFAVRKDAISLARKVADLLKVPFYPLDNERGAGRVVFINQNGERFFLDFSEFRGTSINEDLTRRDFTINAMGIDTRDLSLHDPMGGMTDLRIKIIRHCSSESFSNDPVRILRAIRQAVDFNFHIQKETRQSLKKSVEKIRYVSSERQRDEIYRIFSGPKPVVCLKALDMVGALKYLFPELCELKEVKQPAPHVQDVWNHSLSTVSHLQTILSALAPVYVSHTAEDYFHGSLVLKLGRFRQNINEHLGNVENTSRTWRENLFLATLFHDIAKPASSFDGLDGKIRFWGHDADGGNLIRARARQMKLSNVEEERLSLIVINQMRIHFLTRQLLDENKMPGPKSIYRFFRATGQAGVEICLLALADLWATYENTLSNENWQACLDVVRLLLESWWEKRSIAITPPKIVNGEILMKELSITPGIFLGKVIEAIREEQVSGKVNDADSAISFAKDYKRKYEQGRIAEFAILNKTRLAFFQRPGVGLPILLIHGFPLDHSIWYPLLPHLIKDTHLIMPDIHGHGKSFIPEGPISIKNMAKDLISLLDKLKIDRALIIGHSMGGYISLAIAEDHPDRINGLLLLASRATMDTPQQKAARQKMMLEIQSTGIKYLADSMTSRLVSDPTHIDSIHKMISKMSPLAAINTLHSLLNRQDYSSVLANLKIPVSIIAGNMDNLIPLEASHQMRNLSNIIQYVEMDKVGHLPMVESSMATAEVINNIIKRIV